MSCTSKTTSLGSPVVQNHAWALDEPCRTDADIAAALPGTLRQATIRSKKKEKTSPVAV